MNNKEKLLFRMKIDEIKEKLFQIGDIALPNKANFLLMDIDKLVKRLDEMIDRAKVK